jgi:hypothetical protein
MNDDSKTTTRLLHEALIAFATMTAISFGIMIYTVLK